MSAADRRITVGVAGLGQMGHAMSHRLLDSGFTVVVWNRTAAKAEDLMERGAQLAKSPCELAVLADVILVSLADDHAVSEVLFGEEGMAWAESVSEVVIFEMSTTSPSAIRSAQLRIGEGPLRIVDTSVLGSPFHARSGELRVFVGAENIPKDTEEVLSSIGGETTLMGFTGAAKIVKLLLNLTLGTQLAAMAEAAVLGEKLGLDRDLVFDALGRGGYTSPAMVFRCELMKKRRYTPAAFQLSLMSKDLLLACKEAHRAGVRMPMAASASKLLQHSVADGLGAQDAAAVLTHAEAANGLFTLKEGGASFGEGVSRSEVEGR